ncbi:ribosomal protein S26 [Hamiltosporidium tvaerminnensis]|uniref:Ribosomal protein S26 n=1 Tax=Hamiltosporidium tvaerminnensis TaxID=1176355 RepID=A0A4Q9L6Y0_9MICR|nr:ribosomal protein S26 [Hamiltosporidium tvaerminnensis]
MEEQRKIEDTACPKDKIIKRFQIRNLIEQAAYDDIKAASIYETYEIPKLFSKQQHCVSYEEFFENITARIHYEAYECVKTWDLSIYTVVEFEYDSRYGYKSEMINAYLKPNGFTKEPILFPCFFNVKYYNLFKNLLNYQKISEKFNKDFMLKFCCIIDHLLLEFEKGRLEVLFSELFKNCSCFYEFIPKYNFSFYKEISECFPERIRSDKRFSTTFIKFQESSERSHISDSKDYLLDKMRKSSIPKVNIWKMIKDYYSLRLPLEGIKNLRIYNCEICHIWSLMIHFEALEHILINRSDSTKRIILDFSIFNKFKDTLRILEIYSVLERAEIHKQLTSSLAQMNIEGESGKQDKANDILFHVLEHIHGRETDNKHKRRVRYRRRESSD